MEDKLKIEADSSGVWLSALHDNFTLTDVINFLRLKGVRKYDENAVKKFARHKNCTPQKIADRDPSEKMYSIFAVCLSDDKMMASVTVNPPFFTNPWPSKADILESLERENVVFGVDEKIIEKLAELKLADEHIVVAMGKPPVNGNDARIELLIDPDRAPVIDHDAEKIDHRARSAFINVTQGESIAEKHPATQGESGMTVVGTEISAIAGKDATFPIKSSRSFNVSEDGLLLTAGIDGRLLRKNNMLLVVPELEVKGDVDFSVGNIDFKGSVKVLGSVCEGFQVLARDDVEIKQTVEGARVESSGNITITGGIQGMGRGVIIAAGNITANFVNQAYIRSSGEIIIKNSVLHSDVGARQTVTVMGGRTSQIIGGKTQAELAVICNILGSEMGTKTEVVVGFPPEVGARRKELHDSIIKYTKNLEILEMDLVFLKKQEQTGLIGESQRNLLVTATKSKFQLQAALRSMQDELQDIETRLELNKPKGVVKVRNICYPGVLITIRGSKYVVREAFKYAAFIYDERMKEIELRSFGEVN